MTVVLRRYLLPCFLRNHKKCSYQSYPQNFSLWIPDSLQHYECIIIWTPCNNKLSDNMNNLTTKYLLNWPTCCWHRGYEMRPAPPGERITVEEGSGQSPRSDTGSWGRWFWWWRHWWCWSGMEGPPISFSPSFFSKACWKHGIKVCCRIYSETRWMQNYCDNIYFS